MKGQLREVRVHLHREKRAQFRGGRFARGGSQRADVRKAIASKRYSPNNTYARGLSTSSRGTPTSEGLQKPKPVGAQFLWFTSVQAVELILCIQFQPGHYID